MAAKSIIEIDVQDERFQAFLSAYDNYQQTLSEMPGEWRNIGEAAARASKPLVESADRASQLSDSFKDVVASNRELVASLNASTASTEKLVGNSRNFRRESGNAKNMLQDGAKASKAIAGNIKDATMSFLKWGSVLGIFSGLIGAGGLFGINRLASTSAAQRFTAQGLNTSAGGLDSVAVNFSRALSNPIATLGNIRDVQSDLSRRWAFNALGVNGQGDPASILPQLIKNSRDIYTRSGSTLQGAEAHGLTQFFSIDDLNRFKNMSDAEIDAMAKRAQVDARLMQVNDQTLKQWQDLNVQLDRSGVNIRSAFVTGLAPLTPQLERLSYAVSDFIGNMLRSPQVGQWIDSAAHGLQRLGNYLSSPAFETDAQNFMDTLGKLGRAIGNVATWIGNKFGGADGSDQSSGPELRLAPSLLGDERIATLGPGGLKLEDKNRPIAERNNNPLNIRKYKSKEFMNFDSEAEGFRRGAWQLGRYGSGATFGTPVNTIQDIISRWAPKKDAKLGETNDTQQYIKTVVQMMNKDGSTYSANQQLDLNNPTILSKLLSAMSKVENNRSNFSPDQVRLYITNSTGGSAVVSGAQIAGGQ